MILDIGVSRLSLTLQSLHHRHPSRTPGHRDPASRARSWPSHIPSWAETPNTRAAPVLRLDFCHRFPPHSDPFFLSVTDRIWAKSTGWRRGGVCDSARLRDRLAARNKMLYLMDVCMSSRLGGSPMAAGDGGIAVAIGEETLPAVDLEVFDGRAEGGRERRGRRRGKRR